MKKILIIALCTIFSTIANATIKDSTIVYDLPDSVKVVQFMVEIKVTNLNNARYFMAGIKTNLGSLYFIDNKGKRIIRLQMHEKSRVISTGQGVKAISHGAMDFSYNWQPDKTYKLMVAMASDSLDEICLYSAYIFLPDENKWKFIGTRKHPFMQNKLQEPSSFLIAHKKSTGRMVIGQVWCQRTNGSWKNMKADGQPAPVINLFGHIDSLLQRQADMKVINEMITTGKTDVKNNTGGVYYKMLKEGTGRHVSVTDSVVANYKGYLFNNGVVFDQTKDKPATFALNKLIKGWQIGVPLCKVGGKIKLVIPSDLAYTIRTRSAKIPPNSILVFEIEVVEVKPPK